MGNIMINSNSLRTRRTNLPLLGEGCKDCSVRDKCSIKKCNTVQYIKYSNVSDLSSDYRYYKEDVKFESYIRRYKYGYFLMVKGEKYKSGELDESWHIHFYDKNMKSSSHGISNNGYEVERNGNKYLYIQYLKQHYEISDMIPLKDSKGIILY